MLSTNYQNISDFLILPLRQ